MPKYFLSTSSTGKRRAQSLVEFAMVLPVLLLFIMGTIDFGRALFTYAQASSQLRQALRLAAVIGYDAAPTPPYRDCDRIRSTAQRVFFAESITPTVIYLRAVSSPSAFDNGTGTFDETKTDGSVVFCTGSTGPTNLKNGDIMRVRETIRIRMITPLFPPMLTFTLQGQRTVVTDITLVSAAYCGDLVCQVFAGENPGNCTDCNGAPSIELKAPACGAVFPSNSPVPVEIEALDGDQGDGYCSLHASFVVQNGEYKDYFDVDEVNDCDGDIYTVDWTPEPGIYAIGAQVYDNAVPPHVAATGICTVTIGNPPAITGITTDQLPDGLIVEPSVQRQIKITATDQEDAPEALTVAVSVDRGTPSSSTATWDDVNGVYVTNWTPPASGAALITATVTDTTGMTGTYNQVVRIDTCAVNCAPDVPVIKPPENGATVTGTIPVTVTATDHEDIPPATLSVEISFDGGTNWLPAGHTGDANTTYVYNWNTQAVPNGSYTIQVRATDSEGLTTPGLPVTVTVHNITNTKPTVTIDVPGNGDTVDGTFDIKVTAVDDYTAPAALVVEISIDGGGWIPIGHAGGTTYTFNWNTTLIADGTHTIAARATDDGTPPLQSDVFGPITVTVRNNYPPNVTITSPGDGATVPIGTVTIRITAADDLTAAAALVVQVSIDGGAYQNATYSGSGTSYTYSWDTTGLTGPYTITARATDTGNPPLSTTSTITVTVMAPTSMDGDSITAIPGPVSGSSYWPTVTVTVRDNTGQPAVGVLVSGQWVVGTDFGPWSCMTTASGQCSYQMTMAVKKQESTRFVVNDLSHATLVYDKDLYPLLLWVSVPPPG